MQTRAGPIPRRRHVEGSDMFSISLGGYTIDCQNDGLPDLMAEYAARATLAESIDLGSSNGKFAYLAVRRDTEWPFLVVAQRYEPAGAGFEPGALLVPETGLMFLGAGTRLLAYDLKGPTRLWEDAADFGFFRWRRHDEVVLMSAELELAAWDSDAKKLWSTFVEPPWDYRISGRQVLLDVMGDETCFDLLTGPPSTKATRQRPTPS